MPRMLVAAHEAMGLGVRVALDGVAEVCAEVDTAQLAIRAAKAEQPDVCLIDWDIAGGGQAAVCGVTRAAPDTAVVVLVNKCDADSMLEAVRAGAVGYAPGDVTVGQLHRIIRALGANEAVVPRTLIRELLLEVRSTGQSADGLTGRESQILGMVRRGHSTAVIANRLEIEPVTVRRHISELVRKLGVADRSELANSGRRVNAAV